MRSHSYKVPAVFEIDLRAHKTQARFVDQRRDLQSMVWPLPPHIRLGNAVQLRIYQRKQAVGRGRVAGAHRLQ
jgi:hypothetical protein